MLRQIAEFVAVLSCSPFTGASLYINLVEHPARMECGAEIAATGVFAQLSSSHNHASDLRGSRSTVVHSHAWLAGAAFWWVVAGIVQISVIPFTLIAILPNQQAVAQPDIG